MKKLLFLLVAIIIVVGFSSCKKDKNIDPTTKNVIFTDNPPQALINQNIDQPVLVYFVKSDYTEMKLNSPIVCSYWAQDQYGNGYSYTINKYKIRGRTNFGFYHGYMYVAKSYTDLAIPMDILSLITMNIGIYDYALGKRTPDSSTPFGLTIYDVTHQQ